ncbi:MAG: 30S ribosomal protein S11 [Patescibacteria group bacterium]
MITIKSKFGVARARVYINSTFNNTIITFTDQSGNAILTGSSGKMGFKGTKRGTPFAARVAVEKLAEEAKAIGIRQADVYVKGLGPGREAAIRALQSVGVTVVSITDTTPIPHGGVRQKKPRRV